MTTTHLTNFSTWTTVKPTLQQLITQHEHLLQKCTQLDPQDKEFNEIQQTILNSKNALNTAHQALAGKKSILQQEIISQAEQSLDTLLSTIHTRFLHHHNQHETITTYLNNWTKNINLEEKNNLLEKISTASQSYQQITFFNPSLLPNTYNINTLYNELSYLCRQNKDFQREYAALNTQKQIQDFSTQIKSEKKRRTPYTEKIKELYKKNHPAAQNIIHTLAITAIESIEQDHQNILLDPQQYLTQKEKITQETQKIEEIIQKITTPPPHLTTTYLNLIASPTPCPPLSLISTMFSTKDISHTRDLSQSIYLNLHFQNYQQKRTLLEKVILEKSPQIAAEMQQSINTMEQELTINEKKALCHEQLFTYHQQLLTYNTYAQNLKQKDLATNIHFLKQKIERLMTYYTTSPLSSVAVTATTADTSSSLDNTNKRTQEKEEKTTEKYTPNVDNSIEQANPSTISLQELQTKKELTKAQQQNAIPQLPTPLDIILYAYDTLDNIKNKTLREYCTLITGFDGKKYSLLSYPQRIQHATSFNLNELEGRDKSIYQHLQQRILLIKKY